MNDILVVGAGIFGCCAAIELRQRGYEVSLIDPGPIPHPLASSTDISKVIRMEYGKDEGYLRLAARAREGWLEWNELLGEEIYHECGLAVLSHGQMEEGGFECESYRVLCANGYSPQRLDAAGITARFPAWREGEYSDGFFHAKAGYARSGRVVSLLARHAEGMGVRVRGGVAARRLLEDGEGVVGVETGDGERIEADHTVIAAGAWTPVLVPWMSSVMKIVGLPVFHLEVKEPAQYSPPQFSVFTADIANTGWYGFPFHPTEGVLKVANHGVGVELHPEDDERTVTEEDVRGLREFLRGSLPGLAEARIVSTRRCLYCDTLDGDFWIDRDPNRVGLSIAAGGSGHGFKFGPLLGEMIADAVEGKVKVVHRRFGWRFLDEFEDSKEAARHYDLGGEGRQASGL